MLAASSSVRPVSWVGQAAQPVDHEEDDLGVVLDYQLANQIQVHAHLRLSCRASAATPGSTFPSRNSSDAPPPVET